MNVLQRPLFRQAGGPVAPQAQMQGQDPRLAVRQVEAQASRQAAPLGQQLAQQTMAGIDAAETPEDLINAMRGNARPLEDRYAELAGLVGQADAERTPESVLALVQPTIMMTEQGALDSGIGELMQGLAGGVAMETPDGAPTEMGQGLGSLMMAGARPEETGVGQQPVANFRNGGAVQRFQAGGEASRLQQIYSEMLPVYQGVMGDPEEARRMGQAQILFDIADRAAAFAGGVDPRTGQSIAGRSPAAQLGAAISGLGGQIGQRVAGMEEQDQRLRLAALQAAQGEYSAERAAARAAAARAGERGIGDAYEAVDAEGNVLATEFLSTREDLEAFRAANPGATVRQARPTSFEFDATTLYGPDGSPITFNTGTAAGIAQAQEALSRGFTAVAPDDIDRDIREFGGNLVDVTDSSNPTIVLQGSPDRDLRTVGGSVIDFTDTENPQVLYQGPEGRDIRIVGGRVIDFTDVENPRVLYEPEPAAPSGPFVNIETPDGEVVSLRQDDPRADELLQQPGSRVVGRTGPARPDILTQPDILSAYAANELSPEETARVQAAIAENAQAVFNPRTGQFEQPTITPLVRDAEEARRSAGLSTVLSFPDEAAPPQEGAERERALAELGGAAFGTAAFGRQLLNTAAALVDASTPFEEVQNGVNAVNALNQDALIAFREVTGGRTAQEAINQFQEILPNPAQISGSPETAASQIEQVINLFNANIQTARESLQTGVATPTQRQQLEQGIFNAQAMVRAYGALLQGVRAGRTGGSPVDPAQFRRN